MADFYWVSRSPPTTNTIAGTYSVFASVDGDNVAKAGTTSAIVFTQEIDQTTQYTGLI
jgi:hypothetical protein